MFCVWRVCGVLCVRERKEEKIEMMKMSVLLVWCDSVIVLFWIEIE